MNKGDRIMCWSAKECTHKMMELAKRGIIAEEEPKGSNRLVIKEVPKEESD